MVVFFNGKMVPANEARVGVMSHALSYGTGCFEGIRGYWNRPPTNSISSALREHYERLHRSCRILNIELPYTVDELIAITIDLVRRNSLRENCYIRPFAYKADEIIGVRLNDLDDAFLIYTVPMGDYVATTGLRCGVSSWRRVDDNMIPARAKISGAYVNSAFAKTEALMNGFDEAIMLTSEGHVSEGSAENIFLLVGDELVTPPPPRIFCSASPAIPSSSLPTASWTASPASADRPHGALCRRRNLPHRHRRPDLPVIEVDHRPVGTGKIGPLTRDYSEPITRWCAACARNTWTGSRRSTRPVKPRPTATMATSGEQRS